MKIVSPIGRKVNVVSIPSIAALPAPSDLMSIAERSTKKICPWHSNASVLVLKSLYTAKEHSV